MNDSQVVKTPFGMDWKSVRDDWETPPALFNSLDAKYHFDVDLAANVDNRKCRMFIPYPEVNALERDWSTYGNVGFLNPPYSNWKPWVRLAHYHALYRHFTTVALLPVDTSTKAFHQWICNKPNVDITFLPRRLRFWYAGKPGPGPARFASMVVEWRPLLNVYGGSVPDVDEPPWVVKQ